LPDDTSVCSAAAPKCSRAAPAAELTRRARLAPRGEAPAGGSAPADASGGSAGSEHAARACEPDLPLSAARLRGEAAAGSSSHVWQLASCTGGRAGLQLRPGRER